MYVNYTKQRDIMILKNYVSLNSKRTKNEGYRRSVMSLNPGLDNGNPIIPTNEGKVMTYIILSFILLC